MELVIIKMNMYLYEKHTWKTARDYLLLKNMLKSHWTNIMNHGDRER